MKINLIILLIAATLLVPFSTSKAEPISMDLPCIPGQSVVGSFIIKHNRGEFSDDQWQQVKAARLRAWGASVDDTLESTGNLIEVISIPTHNNSSTIPKALQEAVNNGELYYASPNSTVCEQASGYTLSGSVRIDGASNPAFPRSIAIASEAGLISSVTGGATRVDSPRINTDIGELPLMVRKIAKWDEDSNGLIDLIAHSETQTGFDRNLSFARTGSAGFLSHEMKEFHDPSNPNDIVRVFGDYDDWGGTHMYHNALQTFGFTGNGFLPFFFISYSELWEIQSGRKLRLDSGYDGAVARALSDFDMDGDVDLISYGELNDQYVFRLMKNDGTGKFVLGDTIAIDGMYWKIISIVAADADGNGSKEIIGFRKDQDNENQAFILITEIDGDIYYYVYSFEEDAGLRLTSHALAEDLNGDSMAEYVMEVSSSNSCSDRRLMVVQNLFSTGPLETLFDLDDCLQSLRIADYDGDGSKDVIYATAYNVGILKSYQAGSEVKFVQQTIMRGSTKLNDLELYDPFGVSGAKIRVVHQSGAVFESYTSADGEFSFSGLPAGTYQVSAIRSGYDLTSILGRQISLSTNRRDLNFLAAPRVPDAPAGFVPPGGAPNDPGLGNQWGIYNNGDLTGAIRGIDGRVLPAQRLQRNTSDSIVAVLDSGVDYNHPDLKDVMWRNPGEIPNNGKDDDQNGIIDDVYGFDAAERTGNPFDENRHGTHVAGIIAAKGGNARGVVGVNPHAKVMAVKVFLSDSTLAQTSDILRGLDYIIKMYDRGVKVKVVNASLGGASACDQFYTDMLLELNKRGILFVAAAGNGDSKGVGYSIDNSPVAPASCKGNNIVTVANLTSAGQLAPSSNFGATSVHLGAPGTEILSTVPNGFYETLEGTSMAAPFVAGVASMLMGEYPTLTPYAVRERLQSTVSPLTHLQGKLVSAGMVNAERALSDSWPGGIPSGPGTAGNQSPSIGSFVAKAKLSKSKKSIAVTITGLSGTDPDGAITGATVTARVGLNGKQASKPLKLKASKYGGAVTVVIPKEMLMAKNSKKKLQVFITASVTDNQGQSASQDKIISVKR